MARVALFSVFLGLAFAAPTDKLDGKPLNDFALRLVDFTYAIQRNFGNQNLAVAPIAVWNIFSLLAQGATGNTFQELTQALRLPSDIAATQALHQISAGILRTENKDVVLKGKSAMFVDCTLRIHPEFCETAAGYGNDINLVDASNTTKLARDINYFICVGTDGRIRDAVKAEFLENLRLILVDALYFKASWTYPFDPTHTKEEMFYNTQGKSIGKVNMMYRMGDYPLADVDEIGAQVLGLPYGQNEQFEMLILLPYDGMPLEKLVNNLATQPQDWLEKFSATKPVVGVDVYIPRFKISSQLDLIPSLQYTGIRSIFDDTKSELPGVSDSPLFVSRTIQNVEIEVNEEGTVAAASTFVGLQDRLLGQRFEANKEFVFLIMEKQTNLIVFCGVYNDPSVV